MFQESSSVMLPQHSLQVTVLILHTITLLIRMAQSYINDNMA